MARTLLVVVLLASACSGAPASPDPLDEAAAAWAATKDTCRTYSYVRELPNFVGQSAVEFTDGVLTRRRFTPLFTNNGFDERGAEIGTHAYGGTAKTIEELLSECETRWSPQATTPEFPECELPIDGPDQDRLMLALPLPS